MKQAAWPATQRVAVRTFFVLLFLFALLFPLALHASCYRHHEKVPQWVCKAASSKRYSYSVGFSTIALRASALADATLDARVKLLRMRNARCSNKTAQFDFTRSEVVAQFFAQKGVYVLIRLPSHALFEGCQRSKQHERRWWNIF